MNEYDITNLSEGVLPVGTITSTPQAILTLIHQINLQVKFNNLIHLGNSITSGTFENLQMDTMDTPELCT